MLADPRSKTLATNFAAQWLTVDEIDRDRARPGAVPRVRRRICVDAFRDGDRAVRRQRVPRRPATCWTCSTANYTFVNERLALHYGIPNVRGDRFRRVELTDSNRYGLLGKGALLMATSYPNRTSPVLRGAWILERIIGTPPHAPPPDVEALEGEQGRPAGRRRARAAWRAPREPDVQRAATA